VLSRREKVGQFFTERNLPLAQNTDNAGRSAPRPAPEEPQLPKREIVMQGEIMGARKPSERFFRKPIKAKSRTSQSERIRVAGLANELVQKARPDLMKNEESTFKGYRPGHSQAPG
jgi:hypothetical protein